MIILPEGPTVYRHRAGRRLIKVFKEGNAAALTAATLPNEGHNLLIVWFRVEIREFREEMSIRVESFVGLRVR